MDARNRVRALIPVLVLFIYVGQLLGQTATTTVNFQNNCGASHTFLITHLNGGTYFGTFTEPGCSAGTMASTGTGLTTYTLCPAHTGDEMFISMDSNPQVDTGATIGSTLTVTLAPGTCAMSFTHTNIPVPCGICFFTTNIANLPASFRYHVVGGFDGCGGCTVTTNTDGTYDIYSPILPPGATWSICVTNSSGSTFTMQPEQIIWAGGSEPYSQLLGPTFSCADTNLPPAFGASGGPPGTGPIAPITNAPPPITGTNGTVIPPPNSPGFPGYPGDGQGSNTNLTGGQFSNGTSNLLGAIGALGNTMSAGFGWLGGDLNTITNQLRGTNSGGSLSNVFVLGSYADTNYSQNPGSGTNWYSGTNATWGGQGIASFGGAWTNGLVLTNAMGGPPTNGEGSPTYLYVALPDGQGGTTNLTMDPDYWWPGVPGLIRLLVGWAAAMWFGWWVSSEFRALANTYATAELGGVPDLDGEILGVGGNAIGLIVALAVPAIFVALWVGCFVFFFGRVISIVSTHWSDSPWSMIEGFSGYGSAAIYVLNETLPMPLLLSLAWARMTIPAGLSLLVSAGATVSRFLFGK